VTEALLERLGRTLLYEGYLLYPYRRTSVKNRQRWPLHTLYPPAFCAAEAAGDRSWAQAACLIEGPAQAEATVDLRFLHLLARSEHGEDEAVERRTRLARCSLGALAGEGLTLELALPAEPACAGRQRPLAVRAELRATACSTGVFRVTARVDNASDAAAARDRDQALLSSLASLHLVLRVRGGDFVSLLEPPAALRAAAEECANVGLWPVLIGAPGARDVMLASPIILYDYPAVAAESPGDLFDATEIDEILSLRILTLTDEEKAAVRAGDPRGRALLDRTEALGDADLQALHGAIRERPSQGAALRPGRPVRLRPKGRADSFDVVLAGRTAVIAAVEQDLEGRYQYAVLVDDDPGQDLGAAGFPGHRFFFRSEELEPL
jgi:hypothetical protein